MDRLVSRLSRLCGGSRMMAWLMLVTGGTGILCLLWLGVALIGGLNAWALNVWLALSADFMTVLTHPWTLLTYMLVHYSPLHLIFNLLWLYWFGQMLTDVRGDRALLVLFVGAGIAGGLLYVIVSVLSHNSAGAFLTGDSAAVLGVMTAVGILIPDRRVRLMFIGELRIKWLTLACILLTLLGGGNGGAATQAAHLGGVLWGLLVALAYRNGWSIPKQTRLKASHSTRNMRQTRQAMQQIDPHQRLDELLDKIRISGYHSLSEREKAELNHISSRLGDQSK